MGATNPSSNLGWLVEESGPGFCGLSVTWPMSHATVLVVPQVKLDCSGRDLTSVSHASVNTFMCFMGWSYCATMCTTASRPQACHAPCHPRLGHANPSFTVPYLKRHRTHCRFSACDRIKSWRSPPALSSANWPTGGDPEVLAGLGNPAYHHDPGYHFFLADKQSLLPRGS